MPCFDKTNATNAAERWKKGNSTKLTLFSVICSYFTIVILEILVNNDDMA